MLNVNEGHNKELMEQCQTLKEYAIYVARVRKYTSEMNLNDAVARAIDECIKEGILVEFLRKNRSEVKMVSILEYDILTNLFSKSHIISDYSLHTFSTSSVVLSTASAIFSLE